jgi:hypothetical protein
MVIEIEGIEFTEKQLSEMGKKGLLNIGQKNDPSSATATASSVLHGTSFTNAAQFGLFSTAGVRPERFSALARPRSMARILRPQRSEYTNEIIEIITGQTAGSGNNATDWCAPGPLAGALKTCAQTYPFGNFKMNTRVVPLQEVGQYRNRADVGATIVNNPRSENPLIPDLFYRFPDGNDQLALEFFNLGIEIERQLERQMWQGVVGTDSGIRGWWKDMNSLSNLVKTGYIDAYTNTACPAADSTVVSWNADVGATVSGRNIVQAFHDTYYAMRDLADMVGMEGTQFAWFLRKEQFRALTEVWVCQYATYRCQSGTAGNPVTLVANEMNDMRIEMAQGQYLLIDGMQVPVIFTDGIPLEQLSGGASRVLRSDAFLLPISWNGRPLIRLEYKDMENEAARALANMVYTSAMFINNGMYLLTKNEKEGCIEFSISAKMRMFLETPFLAARIDDISFSYLAPTRAADPGTTFLYTNGGVTYRS